VTKRVLLLTAVMAMLGWCRYAQAQRLPNFVVIFADDLGYGDLGCYGHPTIRTPHLDRMAAEGMRFTQFYSAACVCTPSRAALMTGRLPIRNGMCGEGRVLFPRSAGGLPESEITIAEALKTKGYVSTCIGKWHLGHLPKYLPMNNGFDSYFGIPYSNDMGRAPLMRGEEIIEKPSVQETLTRRYTEEAVKFIKENKDKPFFLYLPHTFPHTPLHASDPFKDKSSRGLYGDVVEELDWSTGEILQTLRDLDLAEQTLVFFTSDNGPWSIRKQDGGSAGLLRGAKGSTWEGGMREPAIAWWPSRIKPGRTSRELASTMDLFATLLTLVGVEIPKDRIIDGKDMTPVLLGTGPSNRNVLFYYRDEVFMAVRKGPWKMHIKTRPGYGPGPKVHEPPLLYNLEQDPSEQYDVAKDNMDVVADLRKEIARHHANLVVAECQLTARLGKK